MENLCIKKMRFVEWNSWSMADETPANIGEWAFFLTIIYLVSAQTLPLTTCFVFGKFFLRFLPVIESCFGFIWQMISTKKNISINRTKKPRSQRRTSGLQCSFYECQNGYYCADGKRSMFHFFSVPLKNPEKTIWCNKMGKVLTKVWKPSVMFTQ